MYFSSLLLGLKRTTQVARDTLRNDPQQTRRADTIHQTVDRLDTNLHDLFRQLDVCLRTLPITFHANESTEAIRSVLEYVYEEGTLSVDELPTEHLEEIRQSVPLDVHASKVTFNFQNTTIKYKLGRPFLEFVVDKLTTLDDLLRRLMLRAKLGDTDRDGLARTLFSGYQDMVKQYSKQIRVSLLIRIEIASTEVQAAGQKLLKSPNKTET